MRTAVLHDSAFCPYETLRLFTDAYNVEPYRTGALASFCGIARAQKQKQHEQAKQEQVKQDVLQSLHLDCYPAMAEQSLDDIVGEAQARWCLDGATIHHRYGEIPVGETIVLVACLSARRNDAFDACRYMTDMVKVRPPLWKREQAISGAKAWLDANDDDTRRAQAWQNQGKQEQGKHDQGKHDEARQQTRARHLS